MAAQSGKTVEEARIVQLIVFHVGEEEFAVPIGDVREIIKAKPVTPVPDSPAFIKGLLNVRGEIVATIDLRARFSMRLPGVDNPKHIIITQQRDSLFGLIVDEVTEVLRVPEADIRKTPRLAISGDETYVIGVIPAENRLIVMLDLGLVLSDEELARLSELKRDLLEPAKPKSAEAGRLDPAKGDALPRSANEARGLRAQMPVGAA